MKYKAISLILILFTLNSYASPSDKIDDTENEDDRIIYLDLNLETDLDNSSSRPSRIFEAASEEEGGGTVLLGNGSGDIVIIPSEDIDRDEEQSSAIMNYNFDQIRFPAVIAILDENDRVIFKQCEAENSCTIFGKPYGYKIENFVLSPYSTALQSLALGFSNIVVLSPRVIPQLIELAKKASTLIKGDSSNHIEQARLNAYNLFKSSLLEYQINAHKFDDNIVIIEFSDSQEMKRSVILLKKILNSFD